MIVEVIATSVEDAKRAERGGADRLELISGILEGGLTPSWGLIEAVVKSVRIPVNVMVRPHSQSFCYTEDDLLVMREDVRVIRELGAAGIVVGMLTQEKDIDLKGLELVLSEVDELDVTFHRAFDEVNNQMEAARTLLHYPQIRRILTSGGQKSATQGMERITQLRQLTDKTQLNILAGSGLSLANIIDFLLKTGVREIHFGTGVREDGHALRYVDQEKVVTLKGICERFSKIV
ncbi:copper homeostasis protein CutC [Brevibacillus sp. NRS-1366]|uniref:copper homeostasis protein CutC n=1 Tax=Brevibacillus sp. NRS-1366 TaxID=3233899 RepID=UPI003D25DEA7